MRLYDKHRPTTLAEFAGNAKAVQLAGRLIAGGLGGQAVWISGRSGQGKTTLARILAASLADPFWTVEYDSADELNQAALNELRDTMRLYAGGRGGRVWIINEAHRLRAPIIAQLNGILERLPDHCAVIFTTTRDGEEWLIGDQIDAGPLLSRCLPIILTNQGLAKPGALYLQRVAQAEGLNGRPLAAYIRLVNECGGNLRAAVERIAAGGMLAESEDQ